jgi:hypothetical protein
MLDVLKFQILQVIMATNRIETLDPALIRPGKCCLADGMNLCVWGGGGRTSRKRDHPTSRHKQCKTKPCMITFLTYRGRLYKKVIKVNYS